MDHYCTAIGYPLGLSRTRDGVPVYLLELRDRTLPIPLSLLPAWARIGRQQIDAELAAEDVAALKAAGAILWPDTRDEFERRLRDYIPIRQGYSALDEKGNGVVYLGNEEFRFPQYHLQLWMGADGKTTVGSILDGIRTEREEPWADGVCSLILHELLYLR